MTQAHFRTCNLCEAMCGIVMRTDGDRIIDVRGDDDDVLSHGHICPKALGLKDIHEDPDRLRRPMRRNGDNWDVISWDEAFDEVAQRLSAIQKEHGRDSVAVYQGNPTVHNHGSMIHGQMFLRALGTRQRYSATSLDQLPHMLAALEMFGHQLMLPIPDLDRTQLFVIFGGNPLASNGSLMSAPGIKKRMEGIQKRGGKVIVVDPRETETARFANQHVFIRPGTDAYVLLAIVRELLTRGMSLGALTPHIKGAEKLQSLVASFTPERVAELTNVPAEVTVALAKTIGDAPSAAVYGRVGVSTQEFGGLATWLINVINIITGNFDRAGGVMFTKPAIDVVGLTAKLGQKGNFARRKTRVRGLPSFGGEYPTATLAEEIETPGPGQIRALVTSAGNPVLSAPNGRRLDEALRKLDFMVSIDIYLNETSRHANLILPPTFALEHDHYDLAFHVFTVRNTAKWSPPLFPRGPEQRHDWEIFTELTTRLRARGNLGRARSLLERQMLLRLPPEHILDLGLRTGPWGARLFKKGVSLASLKKSPHGVDLGPLEPCIPGRLFTADHKVDLVPDIYVADLARLEAASKQSTDASLVLIGRRDLLSNNSWMHNSRRLVKRGTRCTLKMHPDDAARLSLGEARSVRIQSASGAVEAKLELSREMMPGVVSLPHGWGHDREGIRLSIAGEQPGVSVNDITDEGFIDTLTGTIAFSGVPVKVSIISPEA